MKRFLARIGAPSALGMALAVGQGAVLQADTPRSAIPWLSDILESPVRLPDVPDTSAETAAVAPFTPNEILTSSLSAPNGDGSGLLPASELGLNGDLWGRSSALRVRRLIETTPLSGVPATRALYRQVLLARLDPPAGSGPSNAVFLARLDALMAAGMLPEAQDLIDAANLADPDVFRRAFDIALLNGTAEPYCEALRDTPGLSPTLTARVYCLALLGDWSAAALTLNLGREVGDISEGEEDLLGRFLDPHLFEGASAPATPRPFTTIDFVLREAVALPRPSTSLPLAFLWPDAGDGSPLKDRIEARERLYQGGALGVERLFEAYADGRPAASGGVWDRQRVVQALDRALSTQDLKGIGETLEIAEDLFGERGLRMALAERYATQLAALPSDRFSPQTGARIGGLLMLAGAYESALEWLPNTNDATNRFLAALARGDQALPDTSASHPIKQAVAAGLSAEAPPSEDARDLAAMISDGAQGEALLRVLKRLGAGTEIDPGDLATGLYTLRQLDLEEPARRIAVETLLLLPEA